MLTIIQGQIDHGFIPPLRSIRHSGPNSSPQRTPLCCIYLRHWRVLSASRPSMACQGSIWHIMGISDRRCRVRRLQDVPRQPTNPIPPPSRSDYCKIIGFTGHGEQTTAWSCSYDRRLPKCDAAESRVSRNREYGITGVHDPQHCEIFRKSSQGCEKYQNQDVWANRGKCLLKR